MASKGQNFLNYTEEEKNEIIQKYCNGETSGYQLAKQYGIPVSTIKTWKYKIDHPEKITGNKKGRQRKDLTKEDWKQRFEILKKYQAFLKAQRERK